MSNDLGLIVGIFMAGTLVVLMTGMYYTGSIDETSVSVESEQTGLLDTLVASTEFLSNLGIRAGSDIPIIAAMIGAPITFMIVVLGARYLRGQ